MFVIAFDPHDLDAKLVDRKGLDPEAMLIEHEELKSEHDTGDDGPSAHERWLQTVAPLLARLPAIEQDLIELYLRGKRERDLGEMLGLTQAGVSYRIKRARWRLSLLANYPGRDLTQDDCCRDIGDLYDADLVQLVWLVISTTCASEAARRLRWSQGKARFRFLRALQDFSVLAPHYPQLQRYAASLAYVREHGAFLHEQAEHWTRKRKALEAGL